MLFVLVTIIVVNINIVVDFVEPATAAPFHVEDEDLQMINNNERLAVCFYSYLLIPLLYISY